MYIFAIILFLHHFSSNHLLKHENFATIHKSRFQSVKSIENGQGRRGRGTGGYGPPISSKPSDFRKINALLENFQTFAVSIDKSFEFYRKLIELVSPILKVP